jgi:hypothetical protein
MVRQQGQVWSTKVSASASSEPSIINLNSFGVFAADTFD